MPLGFTTNTFKSALAAGQVRYSDLFEWARLSGYAFVEIRDFAGDMGATEIHRLEKTCSAQGVHPFLAWGGPDVLEVEGEHNWSKNIKAAAGFPEPRLCRVTIASKKMEEGTYPDDLFESLRRRIDEKAAAAAKLGVTLVLENSYERLRPDAVAATGVGTPSRVYFDDALQALPRCGVCLDPTNFVVNAGEPLGEITWRLHHFVEQFRTLINYVHVKSSKNGTLTERLSINGDIDFESFLAAIGASPWVCIELPETGDSDSAMSAVEEAKNTLQPLLGR